MNPARGCSGWAWWLGLAWLALWLGPAFGADDATELSYRLARGESVWSVSQTLLAEPRDWKRVLRHNGFSRERKLPPGTIVRIPYAWLKGSTVQMDVAQVHGEATWTHPDNPAATDLKAGMTLRSATQVRTGPTGHVTVRLADGSNLRIAPGSDVRLYAIRYAGTQVTHVRFQLDRGRVETQAAPLRQPASLYEIRTPTAQLGVRGTRFRVALSGHSGDSTAEVVEGAVAAQNPMLTAGSPVIVNAGFGTVVRAGQAPLPPMALLPAPRVTHLADRDLGPAVDVAIPPVQNAVSYRIQVARDAQFMESLLEWTSTEPRIRFSGLGAGLLNVRVRAIDANGLEGHDAQIVLRLMDIQL